MKRKRVIAILACAVLATGLLAGCGSSDSDTAEEETAAEEEEVTEEEVEEEAVEEEQAEAEEEVAEEEAAEEATGDYPSYTIGHNMFVASVSAFQVVEQEAERALNAWGCEIETVDDEASSEKAITDLEAFGTSGVDGVEAFCGQAVLFEQYCNTLSDNGVPFVLYERVPDADDDATWDVYNNSEYYLGAVQASDYDGSYEIGQLAYDNGCRTCVIIRNAVGDYTHDARCEGFEDAFVNDNGGEILYVAYSAESDKATSISDMMTAYSDADCVFAPGGTDGCTVISILQAMDIPEDEFPQIYGMDIDVQIAQYILDGLYTAVSGGQQCLPALSCSLLINYLDGYPITDEDGNAPLLANALPYLLVTDKNAQAYIDLYTAGEWIVDDADYQKLVHRCNPDASIQDLYDFCDNYTTLWAEKVGSPY